MRNTQTLTRIAPLHPPTLIPPAGSIPWGTTPDGKQLWRLVTRRSRAVPDIDPATGQQRWRTNLMGEKILALFKPGFYDKVEIFWLHSQANGNVEHIPYYPPTPEELKQAKRQQSMAEMSAALTGALVDAGVTPDKLVEMLQAKKAEAPEPVSSVNTGPPEPPAEPEVESPVEYPVHMGAKWWTLSDGQRFGGSRKDAEAADKKVTPEAREAYAKAKKDAAAVPSY